MRFLRSSRTCNSSLARPRPNISADTLVREVEKADLGIQLGGDKVAGILFADDFVGVSGSKPPRRVYRSLLV